MRRDEVVGSFRGAIDLLEQAISLFEAEEVWDQPVLLERYADFRQRVQSSNASSVNTLRIAMPSIFEPEFWIHLEEMPRRRQMTSQMRRTTALMDNLVSLLVREPPSHGEQLTIVFLEESEELRSSPQRLVAGLVSIESLYAAVAEIEGENANTIEVRSCDSGSDKSFDLLGLAKVINGIKEILIEGWDRMVFHREKALEVRLGLVVESLSVVERIDNLASASKLEREGAEKLKKQIQRSVESFFEAGVTIPEISSRNAPSDRQLIQPQIGLLAAPAEDNDATPRNPGDVEEVDEIEEFKAWKKDREQRDQAPDDDTTF